MDITFIGTVDKGLPTERQVTDLTVSAYRSNGALLFREEFPLGEPTYEPVYVDVPEGEYYIYAQSDGYRFPWRELVEVSTTLPSPVIELEGTSTKPLVHEEPVLIFGWIKSPYPQIDAGRAEPSHTASRYVGFPGKAFRTDRQILFTQITEEFSTSLLKKKSMDLGYDRNGFFSIELLPDTWYEMAYSGKKVKFKTPPMGQHNIEHLLKQSSRMFLYDIR